MEPVKCDVITIAALRLHGVLGENGEMSYGTYNELTKQLKRIDISKKFYQIMSYPDFVRKSIMLRDAYVKLNLPKRADIKV